ncbi:MAG: hypothetical protein NVSMB29_20040 [Candidatus Dormibacteria bacterium]
MTMTTGFAAVLERFSEPLVLRDFELPTPEPGALLTRINTATICGSDLHIWANELGSTYTLPLPVVLGHEMVGEITALGAGAEAGSIRQRLRVGERVS